MMKKIFISYDYSNDRNYKNMLLAWNENKQFPLNFEDTSADVSINSHDEGVIKRAISAKINASDIVLCLIGKFVNADEQGKINWIKWEIDKAIELNKKIIAVKINKDYNSPENIKNISAEWAMSFNFDAIKKAIDESNNNQLTIRKGNAEEPFKQVTPSSPWKV